MDDHLDPYPTLPVDPDSVPAPPRPLHIRPAAIAMVGLGGLVGTPARYGLDVLFPEPAGEWPVTTFAINMVGALLLGLLLAGLPRLGPDIGWSQRVRLCVGTGILGSFTTYSTFAVGASLLLREHHPLVAATYVAATLVVGFAATATGIALGAQLGSRQPESTR